MRPSASLRGLYGLVMAVCLAVSSTAAMAQTPVKVPGAPESVGRVALSGNGQWAVWADQDGLCCTDVTPFVYLANLQSGDVTALNLHLTTGDTDLDLPNTVFPQVNSDGTRISLLVDGPDGSRNAEILLVIDQVGNELLRVTATDEFNDVAFFHEVAPIDPSGSHVAFSVLATDIRSRSSTGASDQYLVPGNIFFPGNVEAVYRVDLATADIELAYLDSDENEPNEDGEVQSIGGNGRYISFVSFATDLPDADGSCQLFVRDMQSTTDGGSRLVSRDASGARISELSQCGGVDEWTSMSGDGLALAYTESSASSSDGDPHTFIWRSGSGSTELSALLEEGGLSLSADKAFLAPSFETFARINTSSNATDPVTFEVRRPDLSDDGNVLLFFNDELAAPGEAGLWWTLTFEDSPPVDTESPTWPVSASLIAQVTGDDVQLSWPAASDNIAVVEYILFRDDSEVQRINAPTTAASDLNLADNSYVYRVEAMDAAGNVSDTGPQTSAVVGAAPIQVEVVETITVTDQGQGGAGPVVLAVQVAFDEVVTVLDSNAAGQAITVLIDEAITVTDEVPDPLDTPPFGVDVIVITIPDLPLQPGSIFIASSQGWQPLSLVQAFLESTPVLVGEEMADINGNVEFTITVPLDFPPGWHTLALVGTGADGNPRRLEAPIWVQPLDGAQTVAVPGPTANGALIWLLISLILLSAGSRLALRE